MIKQMLKLVWNRKRSNFLIITEIFFSFLVVAAVAILGILYADNRRHPLGFEWQDRWDINLGGTERHDAAVKPDPAQQAALLQRFLRDVASLDRVQSAGTISMTPFEVGAWTTGLDYEGRHFDVRMNTASDGLAQALDIGITRGRWFNASDEAAVPRSVVINERFAKELFGDGDPVGRIFSDSGNPNQDSRMRIVGVIQDFRQHGEYHTLYNYCFRRQAMTSVDELPGHLVIKVRPGTTAGYEENLTVALRGVNRDRTYKITPMSRLRDSHARLALIPVLVLAVVGGFLTLMVGLGMVGVLWQNITRRSREIGLRRAVGGTAGTIYAQVLGELFIVATIGLAFGVVLVVQLPILGVLDFLTPRIITAGILTAAAALYLLTFLAGLYPSWLATKVQPAEVLRYE